MRSVSLFLSTLALAAGAHAADAPPFLGAEQCRIAPVKPTPAEDKISWSGACKDGYANGPGKLEWRAGEHQDSWKLEGTLARGEIEGVATQTSEHWTYTGSFRNGMPHGSGYFKTGKGDQYEGGVADGKPDGPGQFVALDRSSYDGNWKQGQRHGYGKAVFATGGSYEGEWQQGLFHGKGKIVYAGGHTYEGQFISGHAAQHAAGRAAVSGPFATPPARFETKGDGPQTGSHLAAATGSSSLPPEASWEQLTQGQQDMIRSSYPALEDGDEPPYPLKGTRAFFQAVSEIHRRFGGYTGVVSLYVVVGADGAPKSVKTIGAPHPEMGRYLGRIAMAQRFKPALCRGQACEMTYPVTINFKTRL